MCDREKISQKCINAIIKQSRYDVNLVVRFEGERGKNYLNDIFHRRPSKVLNYFTNRLQKQINIRFRHFLLMTLEVAAS